VWGHLTFVSELHSLTMMYCVALYCPYWCTAAGDREGGPPGGPPPRGPAYPPIGIAAAQHSAVQVSQLLGGTPASDRRIQDQLNDLLGSKSRAELWEVMRMLKDLFGGDRNAAKAWFAERPGLSKAVFQAQVLLGEWYCICSCGVGKWVNQQLSGCGAAPVVLCGS
jgi:hypothetical protein